MRCHAVHGGMAIMAAAWGQMYDTVVALLMRFPLSRASSGTALAMASAGGHAITGAMAPSGPPHQLLGAIAGDIIGSVFESSPTKDPNFIPLFHKECQITDDSVLTVATMHALLNKDTSTGTYPYADAYRDFGRRYPDAGYGASFIRWFQDNSAGPYSSWGNGSAMRVSPIGWAFNDREAVLREAKRSAEVTHNHPEGVKGAQATALAIYLARTGTSKANIRHDMEESFGYDLSSKTVDEIRPNYTFDVSCQRSVPEAILCFLESDSIENAIRLAVSLGGDSDTQACIAGSIAEAFYGPIEGELALPVRAALPVELLSTVDQFSTFILTRSRNDD